MTDVDRAQAEAVAGKLTKARRNMILNADLGYGDCDHSMDGPGRRMLYALIGLGLFRSPSRLTEPHTHASYVLSPLGLAVRSILQEKSS